MRPLLSPHRATLTLLVGLSLQSVLLAPALAQRHPGHPVPCIPQPQPCPAPMMIPAPGTPDPTQARPEQIPPALTDPTLGAEQAAAAGGETYAAATPNMLGHLLYGTRSIDFRYSRAAGPINVANNGSTSLVNPSVADDNSPLPRDRVGFRYNYFHNAQQVTGFGPPVFDAQGIGTSFAQTRNCNVDGYTFNVEKTFLDRMASVELRVPFSTGLSPDLNLSAGTISGPAQGSVFGVTATPEQTLGSDGTQFGNLSLIFKALLWSRAWVSVSGGLAVGIPTGADTATNIVDYSGLATQGNATVQRVRQIHLENETWSLSPFLAFLSTPTDRFFTQGFVQFDFPLNSSTIDYTESIPRGTVPSVEVLGQAGLLRFPSLNTPFAVRNDISEQPLMQLDWGVGYWLLRDPSRTWLTGIAPSVELHYTTTLQDASVVTLPGDSFLQIDPNNSRRLIQEQPPRVGNLRNRVDILDMTVASTFVFSDRLTFATGVAFPLKGADDRTFDWEFQLQLNWYFGGLGRRAAPNY